MRKRSFTNILDVSQLKTDQNVSSGLQSCIRKINQFGKARPSGWTKKNLIRRVRKLTKSNYATILSSFIVFEEELQLELPNGEHISLSELANSNSERGPLFLFLVNKTHEDYLPSSNLNNIMIVSGDLEIASMVVELALEFFAWSDCEGALAEKVSFNEYASTLEKLVAELNKKTGSALNFFNTIKLNETACAKPELHLENVDYEKFRIKGVRQEQVEDAVKRLADNALQDDRLDYDLKSRKRPYQATLWLSQLSSKDLNLDWLPNTRIFRTLGMATNSSVPTVRLNKKPHINSDAVVELRQKFLVIPEGEYEFGTQSDSENNSEPPAGHCHEKLFTYSLQKHLFSEGDLGIFFKRDKDFHIPSDHPVTQVNFFEACLIASRIEKAFKTLGLIDEDEIVALPTETEWEAAARGAEGFEYPWSNVFDPDRCNCDLRHGLNTTPVEKYEKLGESPFGILDLSGNVREWTSSYAGVYGIDWSSNATGSKTLISINTSPIDRVVLRGGSYSYDKECVKTWVRNTQIAERRDSQTGFRLVIRKRDNVRRRGSGDA